MSSINGWALGLCPFLKSRRQNIGGLHRTTLVFMCRNYGRGATIGRSGIFKALENNPFHGYRTRQSLHTDGILNGVTSGKGQLRERAD